MNEDGLNEQATYLATATYEDSGAMIDCLDVVEQSEFKKLSAVVELIKRKTDVEYARECVKQELFEDYQKLVMTDIWWDACKAWTQEVVDKVITKYKVYNGFTYADGAWGIFIGKAISPPSSSDIIFKTANSYMSVNDYLNPFPEIEGFEFEKFIVKYCKENKDGNNN